MIVQERAVTIEVADGRVIVPETLSPVLDTDADTVMSIWAHEALSVSQLMMRGQSAVYKGAGPGDAELRILSDRAMEWSYFADDSGWLYCATLSDFRLVAQALAVIPGVRKDLQNAKARADAILTMVALQGFDTRMCEVTADVDDLDDNDAVYRYELKEPRE